MTVGETLTEARYQAGLSVDELSERTKIRGTVIRSIEHDDYEACGGDLYVRGYVRAIAGAVGIDAQPLIREYDQERATARPSGRTARPAARHGLRVPAATDAAATRFDLAAVPAVPADRPTRTRRLRPARGGAAATARGRRTLIPLTVSASPARASPVPPARAAARSAAARLGRRRGSTSRP